MKLFVIYYILVLIPLLIEGQDLKTFYNSVLKLTGIHYVTTSLPSLSLSSSSSSSSSNSATSDEDESVEPSENNVFENEFTAIRIEYIKSQILKKLRLKEKPTITTYNDLPKPIKEYENLILDQDDEAYSDYSDGFYGKTTQVIILPYEDDARCLRKVRFPSVCIPFQIISNGLHSSDVSTAKLWFHKESDLLDAHNQTFVISEVAHWDTKKSFQKTKPIAIQETRLSEGWIEVDLTIVVKNWLDYQDSPIHAINVACKTCGMDKNKSPISFASDLKPFLVIDTGLKQRKNHHHRRPKRSYDCESGVNECCRESFYVSFLHMGWGDWILSPNGYNAYFCHGSCLTDTALTLSATTHGSIMLKVISNDKKNHNSHPDMTLCCAGSKYRPLPIFYMENNKTFTRKLLPDMIVESCGCR